MADSLLITGAAGFIGSHVVRSALAGAAAEDRIVALDKLTYAGGEDNLAEVRGNSRLLFVRGDICDLPAMRRVFDEFRPRAVVNLAAESHVDRSIRDSAAFVQTNIAGVQVLLDACRQFGTRRFVQVSTDEVYGSLPECRPEAKFTEDSPLAPNSPYAASKAAGDCLCRAYTHTFGMDVIITRGSNTYGPRQFPEKLIPLFVTNLLMGRKVPLYGDGLNVRDWLHVEDHASGILAALANGRPGGVYNIGGGQELSNRALTEMILSEMGRSWTDHVELVQDRPGHDRRYALDSMLALQELRWKPTRRIAEGLAATIAWYRQNEAWWRTRRQTST